ncbi:MAG: threonine/homoserine/homoserine lactone efflux protein [Phenylobacterium sp.]|jgi:threonine/homoserine/homoserine lactone efflux protein
MPTIDTLLTFALVSFLLSISPGPSILYIMARSISQGPKAGFAAAGGMAIGSFAYVLATALGIAAIFKYSPMAYTLLKLFGAAYLVYLGVQYFRSSPVDAGQKPAVTIYPIIKIFRQSIVVELTNPKTALFFLALLPQFIDPKLGSVTLQLLVLGGVYTAVTFCCDSCIALASGKLGKWLAQHPGAIYWQDRVAGSVLIGLGAFICYEAFDEG